MDVGVGTSVVGKKIFPKKIKIRKLKSKIFMNFTSFKSCKIHETKISAYMPVLFPFPAVSKANKRIF